MDEKKGQTVGDLDEQVTADDMKNLMQEVQQVFSVATETPPPVIDPVDPAPVLIEQPSPEPVKIEEIPPAAPQVEEVVNKEPEVVSPVVNEESSVVNPSPVIGAATPSDSVVSLPENVSGEKELQEKIEANNEPAEKPVKLPGKKDVKKDEARTRLVIYHDPVYQAIKDEKGKFTAGIPQDTNKNGTAGRPTVFDDVTLHKLKTAFLMGCTDLEACQYAEISKSALYNYQNENPEFVEYKELWKENPILKARLTVYSNMDYDPDLAFKFLERKRRDEFATRQEVTGKDGGAIEHTLDRLESDYGKLGEAAEAALTTSTGDGTPGTTQE